MFVNPTGPRLERTAEISFMGDWGMANLTQVARWLQHEALDRLGPGSKGVIHSGRGGADGMIAAGTGAVDVAVVTPAAFARMALNGTGPFEGRAMPELRALGVVPQDDRLLFVANERLGVSTFAELAAYDGAWTLGTCPNDGENLIGYAAERVLGAHGVEVQERFVDERPPPVLEAFRDGTVDVMAMEGISIPIWEGVWQAQPGAQTLVPDAAVLAELEADLGWPSRPVSPGWWPERADDRRALDFSDFLVLTHTGVPEDLAYLLTWCLFETRDMLERHYRDAPPERSGVTYPLRPEAMAATPIPAHDGAARYFAEAGLA